MLVLTRRSEESIVLTHPDGTRIEIVISQCKNGRATIKIAAPPTIRIIRKEIEDKPS